MPTVISEKTKSRFWSRVSITDNSSDCWEWMASIGPSGYGRFSYPVRKSYVSHRLAYYLHYGVDPGDLMVLHSCDNRMCCNPNHLSLGTHTDNMRDMIIKGRGHNLKGESIVFSKLTEKIVLDIRRRCASGESEYDIANEYNIHQGHVSNIVRRKRWAHI
jgi:hypothetical protein